MLSRTMLVGVLAILCLSAPKAARAQTALALQQGWEVQSSARLGGADGATLSDPQFRTDGWLPAEVPSTVVGTQLDSKLFPDPYFGMNLRSYPGMDYPIGQKFAHYEMADSSPYKVGWWYRRSFQVPAAWLASGREVWVRFHGINYRANVWLNGHLLGDSKSVVGTFREFDWDITRFLHSGDNVLAVEVIAPEKTALAVSAVDWNPMPPDKGMGLWKEVELESTGPVTIRAGFVSSDLDVPSLERAALTVSADLINGSGAPVSGKLFARIEDIEVSQPVTVLAGERKTVRFEPSAFPRLNVSNPRVWWPIRTGPQNLYPLELRFVKDGESAPSDLRQSRFGIRKVTSELTPKGHLLYRINGKTILIRGAGWSPDMLLKEPVKSDDDQMRYVVDLGLNSLRFEGKFPSEHFMDLADEKGVLLMFGWNCCDTWEDWGAWNAESWWVAAESLRDRIRALRAHPAVFTWHNGSDNLPTPDAERMYLAILKELGWPNPVVSHADDHVSEVTGPSGVKMTGPYSYIPPNYWLVKDSWGAAFGFNMETSPGQAIPPIESLRRMYAPQDLWPQGDAWVFHAGGWPYDGYGTYNDSMNARYGEPQSIEEYAMKAQVMDYDGHRAMFEGYSRNKYTSTGVIQWMLNNGWPSMIWHLWDYFQRPGGSYFGAKKGNEMLHVLYGYDDKGVWVVNHRYDSAPGTRVKAEILNFDMSVKFSQEKTLDVGPDSTTKVIDLPDTGDIDDLTTTYFLKLTATDAAGKVASRNFYWLSTKEDVPGWTWADILYFPPFFDADLTMLSQLPLVTLNVEQSREVRGDSVVHHVKLTNPSSTLAFFVRLKAVKPDGDEVLPVLWSDNYVSLTPGESLDLEASYRLEDHGTADTQVVIEGWNIR